MIDIEKLLDKKAANTAQISRRTGMSSSHLIDLSIKKPARLTADEVCIIAFAIDVDFGEMFKQISKGLKWENENGDA